MTTARNDLGVIFATSEAGKSKRTDFVLLSTLDQSGRRYIGTSIMAGDEVSEDW